MKWRSPVPWSIAARFNHGGKLFDKSGDALVGDIALRIGATGRSRGLLRSQFAAVHAEAARFEPPVFFYSAAALLDPAPF